MAAVDLVLPAHNEAASIESTLREFARVCRGTDLRFVVSEDGSSDGTADVVRALGAELPILLISEPQRKGYSRAVLDGIAATTAELVSFVDADGQCDPADLANLLAALPGHEMVVGYRSPRIDHWSRLLFSNAFGFVYRRLFPVVLRDPSCPYLVVRRSALERIVRGNIGILAQGFWWEFMARAAAAKVDTVQVPVRHRARTSGITQVYRPRALPRIAFEHLRGLLRLRRELSAGSH